MKKCLLVFFATVFTITNYAQSGIAYPDSDTTSVKEHYPYVLPFWGQEVTDRNIHIQLPFGINVNYVYNQMTLELTHFSMNFYDGENLDDIINPETLNFTETVGTANGVNLRADAWILPFLNFYGMFTRNGASTKVSFQPQVVKTGLGPNGNLMEITTLEEPIEVDAVEFASITFGFGATAVYGWDDYFINLDGNMTWSNTDLLEQTITLLVASARVGRRINFGNGMKLSVYIGAMYRNFVDQEYSTGSLAVPELDEAMIKAVGQKTIRKISKIKQII